VIAEIDTPHALVNVLEEAGIEYVFGMPGGDTGRLFDALYDSSVVRTILVRHEQTELGKLDYARMAHSMGCRGVRVESLADLGHALDGVRGAEEPTVLDVVTTEDAPFWQVQSPLAKEGPGGE
jgi:acetolactate synthase I/II/III large subunit